MKEEAGLLESKAGFPALCIEQIIYSRDGKPLGWSKMICRGDRFALRAVSEPYSGSRIARLQGDPGGRGPVEPDDRIVGG